MNDWINIEKDPKHIARERLKAKELRQSSWWKNQLAKGCCHYCHQQFSAEQLTMDHIVPVARGGKSSRGNIVPCCKVCNNNKKYLTPVDIILNEAQSKTSESD
jgi:5-methylcytosine-specific restriction protein A